jgi:uncharacterized membrane protein YbhN (UPF0104 family)
MRPVVLSAVATGVAAIAVLVLARVTGVDKVGRAFDHVEPVWLVLIAGAEIIAYAAYMLAYRSIAKVHGHAAGAQPRARVSRVGGGRAGSGGAGTGGAGAGCVAS